MKRTLLIGLFAGLAMLAVGITVSQAAQAFYPSLVTEYGNSNLFRGWSDPTMSLYFVEPFLLGLVLAFVWTWVRKIVPGKSVWTKGACFGLAYWALTWSGLLITFATFPVSMTMMGSWKLTVLLQSLVAGWIYARFLKQPGWFSR